MNSREFSTRDGDSKQRYNKQIRKGGTDTRGNMRGQQSNTNTNNSNSNRRQRYYDQTEQQRTTSSNMDFDDLSGSYATDYSTNIPEGHPRYNRNNNNNNSSSNSNNNSDDNVTASASPKKDFDAGKWAFDDLMNTGNNRDRKHINSSNASSSQSRSSKPSV